LAIKEMRLDLTRWYERSQDDTSFLVAITLAEDLFDASESVPDQFCCILGGYEQGDRHSIGVLWFICKTIGHEKDRHDTSGHLVST